LENTEENSEKIGKIWKNCKLKSEMIWKIWQKSKLNGEIIWKCGRKVGRIVKRNGNYGRKES
jgi:hypothetical protein